MPSANDSDDSETRYNGALKNLNIFYPVCANFVRQDDSDDKSICVCNRPESEHFREERRKRKNQSTLPAIRSQSSDRKHKFTREYERAVGQLINGASFIRFAKKTSFDDIQNVLTSVWDLTQPKLILSVIGGTKYFTLSERLETNLTNGIIGLASRSDIWLITNGYDNGVAQLIGQAIHKAQYRDLDRKTAAIGICKWSGIKAPEKLLKRKKNKQNKKKHSDTSESSSDEAEEIHAGKEQQRNLNMNLSHYLFYDDGIYNGLNLGDFRTRLCDYLGDHLNKKSDDKYRVPTVTIVIEGGDSTIENIYNDLRANIPIVIIDGSGRVADFFSRWLTYTKDLKHSKELSKVVFGIEELKTKQNPTDLESSFPTKTKTQVLKIEESTISATHETTPSGLKVHQVHVHLNEQKLSDVFSPYKQKLQEDLAQVLYPDELFSFSSDTSNEYFNLLCQKVMYCLQPSVCSKITVFNPNCDSDLSETLFRSISETFQKSSSDNDASKETLRKTLLGLAMDWNCVDVAKEFVFENSLADLSVNMSDIFIEALKRNLFTFVYEFLKLGLDPTEIFFSSNRAFITKKERYDEFIKNLYANDVLEQAKTDLLVLLENNGSFIEKTITTVADLNIIFRELIGDFMHKLYYDSAKDEYIDREHDGLILKSNKKHTGSSHDAENPLTQFNEELARDYIMRDLFLWAILMNYIDMAKVLLSFMKYRICPALIASKILKAYEAQTAASDKQDQYKTDATYFEQYAIDCVDYCDDIDVDKTFEIILQRNEVYGYVTCAQVASIAHDKKFLGEACCGQVLSNVWSDKLVPQQKTMWNALKFIIAILTFGLTAPGLKFRKCDRGEVGESLQEKFRSCGIDYSDPYPIEYPRRFGNHHSINRSWHQIANFHHAPMVKFAYHLITYVFFLLLFSYVLLFKFSPPTGRQPSIDWTEILSILLVSCMFIEELRYFVSLESLTVWGKTKHYFRDIYKWITFFALILFYIGLFLRFLRANNEQDFIAARVVMAYDIELWWLGLMSFIIVIPELGPHLVAIQKMIRDLGFFILIILIVMIGYGVTTRSMYFYQDEYGLTLADNGTIDTSFDGRSVFRQVLYPVYYFLHGEIGSELDSLNKNANAAGSITSYVLFAAQMLFVNILLTNLLIAMFSKRFEEVYDDTRNIWLYQKYLYTREYYIRSPFFPPFSVGYDFYYLFRRLYFSLRKALHKTGDRNQPVFKIIPINREHVRDWKEFEGAATYEYSHYQVKLAKLELKKQSIGQESSEETDKHLTDASDTTEDIRIIQDDMSKLNATLEEMKTDLRIQLSKKKSM